jgi:AcrR family transcriptional regulator
MREKAIAAKLGRPRCFCEEAALDAAMRVFWAQGYEAASLTDLTEAMGISRPSLYAAFGDKEALFRKAMARYAEGPAAYLKEALEEPTARGVIEALLRGALTLLSDPTNPRGCLSVQGALAAGDDGAAVQDALAGWRRSGQAEIQKRLKRLKRAGDLPVDEDPAALAAYVATLIYGLAVQAASGAGRSEMERIVERTLLGLGF